MKQSEYRKLSAGELTIGVRDGLFSKKEVFEAFRLAAEADKSGDLPLNSLISVNDSPQFSDGPLAGLPMLYKDNINTSELPTTVGSIVFENAPAAEDADVVRVLRGLGAVTAAKARTYRSGQIFEDTLRFQVGRRQAGSVEIPMIVCEAQEDLLLARPLP